MRLRNIPAAADAVAESPFVIRGPFPVGIAASDAAPLHIEIGMGKGQFLLTLAALHPQIRYIGIERYTSVLYRALQKMDALSQQGQAPENLSFICIDAAQIESVFKPGSVDLIYLNFPDPWPKKRHASRRLTSRPFLTRYRKILSPAGQMELKTDNTDLFQFTLEELDASGWQTLSLTRDLHHDPVLRYGNHMTEYEEKFSGEGHPICKVIAVPPCI